MASETSRSNGGGSAADSYIGSLISLTSKSDIRYEGFLFNVDTTQASIGLRDVRSFGTEGRRKDGPQVPANDKVYEYIVFRGTDIKDLQVKSAPPVQTAPSVHNDPAIIQSHSTLPTAPSSFPTAPATAAQIPYSGTTYQNITPLYPPVGNLPSWNPSPPPTINSSGLPGTMYWPGYYSHPTAVQPQQPLLQPVQGFPQSSLLQPLVEHPNTNSSFPIGASNIPASQSKEFPSPPNIGTTMSSNVIPPRSSELTTDSSNMMPSKAPPQAASTISPNTNPSLVPSSLSNISDKSIVPMPINSFSEPLSSVGGTSSSHVLVTPGQFLQPGPTVSQSSQMTQKDVEVVQAPSFGSSPQPEARVPVTAVPESVSAETQPPLLPLPSPVSPKMNGVSSHTQYVNRDGRERGRRNELSRSVPNYTEEFDFEAMNERFKKDEVWGHLGGNISKTDDGLNLQDEDDADVTGPDKKPIYQKDDFFDTLSCTALDHGSRNRRPRFSEQMRVDTETFGDFSRNQGFRGGRGRGPGRGGWSRGGYHGRGGYSNGYGGRGRGQNVYRVL